jgi:hypothetical protein
LAAVLLAARREFLRGRNTARDLTVAAKPPAYPNRRPLIKKICNFVARVGVVAPCCAGPNPILFAPKKGGSGASACHSEADF